MTTEPNVCPHCGEEKPTPHVLVLKDDQYCEECWAELCSATYAEYYPKQLETVPLTSEVMMSDERMVMDKEQAAAFGQYVMDMIASHFADELRDIEMPTIDNEKMVDGYIRVWQRLKMENAALTAENAELRKRVEGLESSLKNMRRYSAVQGRLDDGEELAGLAYDGSIWGPCADPKYEMYELAESVEKWLHEKIDTALSQRKEGSDACPTVQTEDRRCNICGGLVHYDGTPPVKGCWPAKSRKEPCDAG